MKKLVVLALIVITSTATFAQKKYTPNRTSAAPLGQLYGSSLFRSVEGIDFDLENDNGTSGVYGHFNILDWLQGKVAGLQVYTVKGTRIAFIRNYPATIYVDEIRTDASFLSMLPVIDIALIRVIKTPFAGIMSGPGGAIAIYTKRGEGEEEE